MAAFGWADNTTTTFENSMWRVDEPPSTGMDVANSATEQDTGRGASVLRAIGGIGSVGEFPVYDPVDRAQIVMPNLENTDPRDAGWAD